MATIEAKLTPYESLFIVPPETRQDKIDALVEKIKTTVKKESGSFRGVQVWGRRRLAYPIKHNRDGLYVYVDFDGSFQIVSKVQTLYNVTDIVVRHLTVVREEPPPPKVKKPKKSEAAKKPGEATSSDSPSK